jgi:hypothetical protein
MKMKAVSSSAISVNFYRLYGIISQRIVLFNDNIGLENTDDIWISAIIIKVRNCITTHI